MNKPETYNRSRLEILGALFQFGMSTKYSHGNSPAMAEYCWIGGFGSNEAPPMGSLCRPLSTMGDHKWYLGWLVDYKGGDWPEFYLKSIEDGSICRWSNIGISYLPMETTGKRPSWKWTDRQYQFQDMIYKAIKKADDYFLKFAGLNFHSDNSVTVRSRGHMWVSLDAEIDKYAAEKTFPDYRKVKLKELTEFFTAVKNKAKEPA